MNKHLIPLLMLLLLCGCNHNESAQQPISTPTVSEVRDIGRLQLAEMTVSKMGTIDDLHTDDATTWSEKALAIWNSLKIGSRKGAWSYDTYLRAYIDLSTLNPSDITLDSVSHTAKITLPAVQTQIIGRDVTMRQEHYRVTGLRSDISADERARLKEEMNTMLRREIAADTSLRNSLAERARQRARTYFDSLYSSRGYTAQIDFK